MFSSHHHIFLAGLAREFGPGAGGVRLRPETFCELFVIRYRNGLIFHHPFVTADDAVESPVDEHPETRFVPPFHAALAILIGGRMRSRLCSSCRRACK